MLIKNFCAILMAAFVSLPAVASTDYFLFTYSGKFVQGHLDLLANDNGDGSFTAVSGDGAQTSGISTESIRLVFNPAGTAQSLSPAGAFTFDNQIFGGSAPLLSGDGLLFTTPNQEVNIGSVFENGMFSYRYYDQNLFSDTVDIAFIRFLPNDPGAPPLPIPSIDVPEPASVALFGIAFVGMAALRRNRQLFRRI